MVAGTVVLGLHSSSCSTALLPALLGAQPGAVFPNSISEEYLEQYSSFGTRSPPHSHPQTGPKSPVRSQSSRASSLLGSAACPRCWPQPGADCSPGCGHCPAAVSHPRCQSSPLLHPAVLPGHHRQLSICPLHTTQPATPSQSGFSSKRLEKSTAVSKLSATYLYAPTFDFRHIASCFQNHSAQHARTHSFLWALKV